MDDNSNPEDIEKNQKWFESYLDSLKNHSTVKAEQEGVSYRCLCCGYKTLDERGGFEICAVCFWEDDGQDEDDADQVRGGSNGALSLTRARENFRAFGACEQRFVKNVRRPLPDE